MLWRWRTLLHWLTKEGKVIFEKETTEQNLLCSDCLECQGGRI